MLEHNEPKNQAVITVDLNKYELQSDQKLENGKCSFTEIRIVRKPEVK